MLADIAILALLVTIWNRISKPKNRGFVPKDRYYAKY
jgi:hypothetical protein